MESNESLTLTWLLDTQVRLDVAISECAQQEGRTLSRSRIKRFIKDGLVTVDGVVVHKPGFQVALGGVIELILPATKSELDPFDFPLEILHEDEHLLVINKPAALTMHPGAGTGNETLANAVQSYLQDVPAAFPEGARAGIVHRLDKDTSGVVVVARTAEAHAHLAAQFAERSTERRYLALVAVTPRANRLVQRETTGTIETQIGRHPSDRLRYAVVETGGKRAITHWQRLDIFPYAALLELRLETGRTHQIRVHMELIRSPIVGDPVYGVVDFFPREIALAVQAFGRQALHAKSLAFQHPVSGERLSFEVPVPSDMDGLQTLFAPPGV